MFSLDLNGNNLGLWIFSWGLGAVMMYSSNFGFWSSVSFLSPDDFTSGFTGSGGLSLLWAPFVQPFERKEKKKSIHGTPKNYEHTGPICGRPGRESMPLKATESGGTSMEDLWYRSKDNRELTAMLRKSEKSVVLLLQQDHPCRKLWDALNFHRIFWHETLEQHFTFNASWNTGTPGWKVQASIGNKPQNGRKDTVNSETCEQRFLFFLPLYCF